MDRQIVYFQIPTLEIALARLVTPSLRHRPVAIAPVHTPRALLQEVSPEARQEGVVPGTTVEEARRRCSALCLLPPDPAHVREAQRALHQVVTQWAPIWEPVRPGQLFLDLTGTERLFGPAADTAARIEREVAHRHGLTGVAGVASNKLVSRVAATLMQPPQLCEVRPGSEQPFLAPLPVSCLPGFSYRQTRTVLAVLDDLNLQTLGEIAEIPLPHLELVLGPPAGVLHQWAQGIDPSPVLPVVQQPRLELSLTLEPDEVDDDRLMHRLYGLLEQLCQQLRSQQRVCGRLVLTVLYSDHRESAGHRTLTPGTYWEADMYPCLKELFFRSFQRRVRLRRLTLTAEALGPPEEQLSLFDLAPPNQRHTRTRAQALALALDRLRERFGERAIGWGRLSSSRSSLPP